jgi:hypothetical protein
MAIDTVTTFSNCLQTIEKALGFKLGEEVGKPTLEFANMCVNLKNRLNDLKKTLMSKDELQLANINNPAEISTYATNLQAVVQQMIELVD